MFLRNLIARSVPCTSILGLMVIIVGCSGGEILVSRPEVFTRARLVSRRLGEQQWLEAQLANTPTGQSFQGYSDIRTFEGLYSKTNATFDPLGGKLAVAQNQANVQSLQDETAINGLKNQIELLKLQQGLATLKTNPSPTTNPTAATAPPASGDSAASNSTPSPSGVFNNPPPVPSPADIVPTQAKITSIELLRDQLAFRNAIQSALREQELDDAHDLHGNTLYTLKFDLSVLPESNNSQFGKVVFDLPKLTCEPGEEMDGFYNSWFWSVRRAIQAEAVSLEQRSDAGLLSREERIRLAALAAAAPAHSHDTINSALAQLQEISNPKLQSNLGDGNIAANARPEQPHTPQHDLQQHAQTFIPQLHNLIDLSASQSRMSISNTIQSADQTIAQLQAISAPEVKNNPAFLEALEGVSKIKSEAIAKQNIATLVSIQGIPTEAQASEVRSAVVTLLSYKYGAALKGLATFGDKGIELPALDKGKVYLIPDLIRLQDPNPGKALCTRIDQLRTQHLIGDPYVFLVDPKEESQNISDVRATEQLKNFVLSIQAALPQAGLNGGNYSEYMRRSQERLQGILRRPLVVGFADTSESGTPHFGWILGPRFEIGKSGKPTFTHTAVQHSVQAVLAVPGWMRHLPLSYNTYWVDASGNKTRKLSGSFEVDLPGSASALTSALLSTSNLPRLPLIEAPQAPDNSIHLTKAQAGKSVDLIIHGQELWRNPKVFVGGQPADSVSILPDMNGLSVHINAINMPPHKTNENPLLDLNVVTSEGSSMLYGAVQVFTDLVTPADKLTVGIESKFAVALAAGFRSTSPIPIQQMLTLSAPTATFPDAFGEIQVRIRPLKPGEEKNITKITRSFIPLDQKLLVSKQGDKTLIQLPYSPPTRAEWSNYGWNDEFSTSNDAGNVFVAGDKGVTMQVQLMIRNRPDAAFVPVSTGDDSKALTFVSFPTESAAHPVLLSQAIVLKGNVFQQGLSFQFGADDLFANAFPGLLSSGLTIRFTETLPTGESSSDVTVDPNFVRPQVVKPTGNLKDPLLLPLLSLNQETIDAAAMTPPADPKKQADPFRWVRQRVASTGGDHTFKLAIIGPSGLVLPIEQSLKISFQR